MSNKNVNIQDNYNDIVKYIKNHVDSVYYKRQEITNTDSLSIIKNKNYIVSYDTSELSVWIAIFMLNGSYYSVVMGKFGTNPIYKIDISAIPSVYEGTIMDGYYIDGNEQQIIINDIFYLEGHNIKNNIFEKRKEIINDIFYENIKIKKGSCLIINILPYYKANDEKGLISLFEELMTYNLGKNKYKINNWLFYPNLSHGKKDILFFYKIKITDLIKQPIKIKDVLMRKTNMPDVYYIIDTVSHDLLGQASVPTASLSKQYREWFKTKTEIKIECKYDERDKKWIPLQII